ncbi:MAG: hypothetical protein WBF29_17305, partial [Syntrophobacteria bacterium]
MRKTLTWRDTGFDVLVYYLWERLSAAILSRSKMLLRQKKKGIKVAVVVAKKEEKDEICYSIGRGCALCSLR